jgi:DNA-binding transcriptional regulator YiaG
MKCRECGAEMRVAREEWPDPDLPGVVLRDVEVRRCVEHPEHYEVELPHMNGLHRAIAGALLTKRTRLAGAEIRCLRELCDWDTTRLATLLEVSPATLARWEKDELVHGGTADRLLRMVAAEALSLPAPRDVLEHDIGEAATPILLVLRFGLGGWRVVDDSDPVSVWVSCADEDREAVLETLEALKGRLHVLHVSDVHDEMEKDAERALGVAVETLRALHSAPEPRAPEVHAEP